MDWLQTLVLAIAGPVVTAVALIWQDRANTAREDRRRADEREAQRIERAEARKHAVRDHWREERKAAHTSLLTGLEAAATELQDQHTLAPRDLTSSGLTRAERAEVESHFAAVQMLGSRATRQLAEESIQAFREANAETYLYAAALRRGTASQESLTRRRDSAALAVFRLNQSRRAYLDAVRKELGTEDDDAGEGA